MLYSSTTTSDNERILFYAFEGPVHATITFTPEEAKDAIRQLQREVSRIEKIAALQAIRDEAEKALSEVEV